MAKKKFVLTATIKSSNPMVIEPVLKSLVGVDALRKTDGGFLVRTTMEGDSAKDSNRVLLSELRREEKKTTLHAKWTHGRTTERFFDYVLKGIEGQ